MPQNKNRKVLLLASASNVHTLRWANGLVDQGLDIHLAFIKGDDKLKDEFDPRVKLHSLAHGGKLAYFRNVSSLRKLIKKIQPQVLHSHYITGYGTLGSLSGFKPHILSPWGSDIFLFPRRNPLNKALVKRNLKKADLVLSSSKVMAKEIGLYYGGQVVHLPFGIDLDLFNPEKYPRKKEEANQLVIGSVKALKRVYGLDILIRAFSTISLKDPEMDLLLSFYGSGPEEENLKSLVRELGLEDRVVFHGEISNSQVPRVLSQIDIFSTPSRSESFGVSALEAMAMELPVVLSSAPGFLEITDGGIYGKITRTEDPDSLAKALDLLIKDEEERHRLGQEARSHVEKNYRWSDNIETMTSIYKKFLD